MEQFLQKLSRVRLCAFDFDGIITDGFVTVNQKGDWIWVPVGGGARESHERYCAFFCDQSAYVEVTLSAPF
jgi:hypothetical protein